MNLKNINYSNNLSIVFSFLETHSSVNRDIRSILKDAVVTGAGFIGIIDDKDGDDCFESHYKSTSMGVKSDQSIIKVRDYKYLTTINDDYSIVSNKPINDESIILTNLRFEIIDGVFRDKAVILSDDKDPIIIEKLSKFYFEV